VDFAKAIDLDNVDRKSNEQRWMDQVFSGDTTVETMKCVSMRLGLPWSFDLDTFGICACVYLLMHGTTFDIQQRKDTIGAKRWVPLLKFPRHFQTDLWTEIFDTLLNLDEDFGRAIGSRPYNLKRLRKQIEEHLQIDNNVVLLDAALRYQFSMLSP
jgi:checkpoint serine/threonine-protein kinase